MKIKELKDQRVRDKAIINLYRQRHKKKLPVLTMWQIIHEDVPMKDTIEGDDYWLRVVQVHYHKHYKSI